MFLHRLPVEAEPAFAAALDVGVGIEFGVRGGTDFGDFFPVGFAGEQKQFGVGVVAGQMAQLFEEIRQKRPLRIVWGGGRASFSSLDSLLPGERSTRATSVVSGSAGIGSSFPGGRVTVVA